MILDMYTGNVSSLEINPYDFPPDTHTLTITFTDSRGNMGSSQFNFTSMERQRECWFKAGPQHVLKSQVKDDDFLNNMQLLSSTL